MSNLQRFLPVVFLFVFSALSQAEVRFYDRWGVDGKESDECLVLARVESEKDDAHLNAGGQKIPASEIEYTVTVLREIRHAITDNTSITIAGHRLQAHSADANDIPLMERGAVFVMVLKKSNEPAKFVYEGDEILPIGIKSPAIIDEKDIPQIESAFPRLVEVCRQHDPATRHAVALIMMRSQEYYTWALGSYMLASEGMLPPLLDSYRSPSLNLQQALWLDHVLGHIMPQDKAPTIAQLHQLLVAYLWERHK